MTELLIKWFETRISPFKPIHDDITLKTPFGLLLHFVKQARWPFISMLLLGMANGIMDVLLFVFVGKVIDYLTNASPTTFHTNNLTLWAIGATVLVLRPALGTLASLVSEQIIQANFSPMVRWQVHRRIMTQSVEFFQKDFAGNVASKVWQSGQSAAEIVGSLLQIVWSNVVYVISVVALFGWLDWRLSLIVVVWIAAFAIVANIFIPLTRARAKISAEASNAVNGHLVDVYGNIQTVKLFASKATEEAYIRGSLGHFIDSSKSFLRAVTGGKSLMILLSSISITFIGITVVSLWMNGKITPGQIAIIFGLVLRLDGQLNVLLGLLTNLFRAYGTFQSSMSLATKPLLLADRSNASNLHVTSGRITFERVAFNYGRERQVLDDLSFTIGPGEKVGLVGHSGAGKSTIAHLLLRFYDVQSGAVTIDGEDVRNVSQETLRECIGLVTQDTSLLHRSVMDNIRIGRDGASLEEVTNAARRAHAFDFIEALQDAKGRRGFEAHVGERGLQLSGGQRQRIAIARVFLKNPPILILDEATSALDAELDADIQETLLDVMDGKSVLAIAHRLSTIMKMDRLLVLEGGRIVESGTHEALLNDGGIYASLWQKQFHGLTKENAYGFADGLN